MKFRGCALFWLALVVPAALGKPLPDKTVPFSSELLMKWAEELPFFCAEDFFFYGRMESIHFRWEMPPALGRKYTDLLRQATSPNLPEKELVPLLKHPNPRVRMLALAALFHQENSKNLPLIAALFDDGAAAIPKPMFTPRAYIQAPPEPAQSPPLKPQAVGAAVKLALKTYLQAAGIFPREDDAPKFKAAFAAYWAERKDRPHCASWILVRVQRAAHGTSGITKESIAAIKTIRGDVDRLPPQERAWTLLWVGARQSEYFATHFAKDREIVQAGKTIGPKALLAMLEGGNPSGDPDLKNRYDMPVFVLKHVPELLEPTMADRVLELGRAANDNTAHWDVAAARLVPDRGAPILEQALARLTYQYGGQPRAELAVALWQNQGLKKTDVLLDWFYTEKQAAAFGYFNSRGHFLREVGPTAGADTKTFLAKLIADPRFAKCDWQSVIALNEQVSRWTKEPVIAEEEIRNNNPAAGADFELNLDSARKMYPKETERSLQLLENWRQKLRASVAQWSAK